MLHVNDVEIFEIGFFSVRCYACLVSCRVVGEADKETGLSARKGQ